MLLIHPGTQHSFHLARELNRVGILFKFYTGFAFSKDSFIYKISSVMPMLKKRYLGGVHPSQLVSSPLLESISFFLLKLGFNSEMILANKNRIFQNFVPDYALKSADIVIGFDTCSWIISRRCRSLGKPFILEASIGHPVPKNKIFARLISEFPQWKSEIPIKKRKYISYEEEEIANATCISVPSTFVRRTYLMENVPAEKIIVNSFGTDIRAFSAKQYKLYIGKKIRFLFFGSLNARKGLPLLLKAWEHSFLEECELTIAGFGSIPAGILLPKNVINAGTISKEDREQLYHRSDVFVFPSYYEGFAQVLIEAAASGLPIISTINSGAEEIVENGKNGFIIEEGNESQLIKAITFFINNSQQIPEMGSLSRRKAEKFNWGDYGKRWNKALKEILEKNRIENYK